MHAQFLGSALAFRRREDGPTAVEYALLTSLVVVACVAAVTLVGTFLGQTFVTITSAANPTS